MDYGSDYDDRFIILSDSEDETEELRNKLSNCAIFDLLEIAHVILSIDIGITHLGISVSLVDKEYKLHEIVWINLIDITEFHCQENCKLYHSKTFTDWLSHVFVNEWDFFEWADVILIERQPPQGLTAVEQIIFFYFREKAILISPTSVHAYFGINCFDYERRKVESEKIAVKHLQPNLLEQLYFYERQHDITDSVLFTLFWCSKQRELLEKERLLERQRKAKIKVEGKVFTPKDFFEAFKYIPP